jgi:hypothetical protein
VRPVELVVLDARGRVHLRPLHQDPAHVLQASPPTSCPTNPRRLRRVLASAFTTHECHCLDTATTLLASALHSYYCFSSAFTTVHSRLTRTGSPAASL